MQSIAGFFKQRKQTGDSTKAPDKDAREELMKAIPEYHAGLFARRPIHITAIIMGGEKSEAAYEATQNSVNAQDYPYKSVCAANEPLPRYTEYVLPLCAGDMLFERAFTAVAREISAPVPPTHGAHEESVFVFSDEIVGGKRIKKREYSEINSLTSSDAIGALFVMRTDVYLDALRQNECNKSRANTIALARTAAKLSSRRAHIPLPLIARDKQAEDATVPSTSTAQLYFTKGLYQGSFRARRRDANKQRVCAVIPVGDEYGDINELRLLLESLDECAMHDKLKTHIVTSPRATLRQLRYCEILQKNGAARHIKSDKTQLSALMNEGARSAEADALLFVLPGLEAITPELVECLLDALALPNAALSAPKLVSADGRIFSAGEAVKKCALPDINELSSYIVSPFAGEDDSIPIGAGGADKRLCAFTMRQTSLVSCECIMVSREAFYDAGCFDETLSCGAVAELCLRLFRRNRACVFTPYAKLISRRDRENIAACDEKEKQRLMDTLRPMIIKGDPYFIE